MISWEIPRGLISHALQSKSRHSRLCSKMAGVDLACQTRREWRSQQQARSALPLNSRAVGQGDQEFFALPASLKCSMSARKAGEVLRLLG